MKWIAAHCEDRDGLQVCKKTGRPTEIIPAYLSIHDERFTDCVGWGRVLRLAVPFCPDCEPRPADSGCLHGYKDE